MSPSTGGRGVSQIMLRFLSHLDMEVGGSIAFSPSNGCCHGEHMVNASEAEKLFYLCFGESNLQKWPSMPNSPSMKTWRRTAETMLTFGLHTTVLYGSWMSLHFLALGKEKCKI